MAAGSSSRLGKPKQNLVFHGKTLLEKAMDEAVSSCAEAHVVVLGANQKSIEKELKSTSIPILYNPEWETGMASSIKTGLDFLMTNYSMEQVILMLCDQPFVNARILDGLVQKQNESGKGIVACSYADTIGVPALFSSLYFPAMQTLSGKDGAKKIMLGYLNDVAEIAFPLGEVDIDTSQDYDTISGNTD